MAFLLPLLEGAAPMLLGALAGPTLTRVGTKIDQKLAPQDYGMGIRGLRKKTARDRHESARGLTPQYGPAKGLSRHPFASLLQSTIRGGKRGVKSGRRLHSKKRIRRMGGFVTQVPVSNDNITTSNPQV